MQFLKISRSKSSADNHFFNSTLRVAWSSESEDYFRHIFLRNDLVSFARIDIGLKQMFSPSF